MAAAADAVLAAVRETGLLAGERPVVALISGGRDSTCLIGVCCELLGPANVTALHVNYGLRDAADDDEAHCRALSDSLGVQLDVVHAERSGDSGNLQAWARDVRYAAGRERAASRGALLAAGHTADDQLETILYRLAASPGRRALLGMSASDGDLVRPLLGVSREQTATWCLEHGHSWREDESNSDERFARTRVREQLVPALVRVHSAAAANVLRSAELLRAEAAVLDGLVAAEIEDDSITVDRLAGLPQALARLVLIELAERAAGTYVPQAGERLSEILALAARSASGEVHVGALVAARLGGGRLRMVRLPPRAGG